MNLLKKLSVILLGICLLSLTGCQSSKTSSPHKNGPGEVSHSKVDSSTKDDKTNDSTANTGDKETNDQTTTDQPDTSSSGKSDNTSSNQSNVGSSDANQTQPATPPQKQIMNGKVTAVRIADTKTGWIGGAGWIAKTTDGGKNWGVQYQGEQTVHQLFALNHQDVWVTFENISDSSTGLRLLKSSDGGQHWSPVGRVPSKGFLHFISETTGFSGNVETLDGGRTWTSLPLPKGATGDAYFHDTKNGWVVVKGKDVFQVMRTTDGAKSWKTVLTKKLSSSLNGVVIRSAGAEDAWIECIGDSGMTQTSYSLFHTSDGGKRFQVVIANSTAGGGPAPGFSMNDQTGPHNQGSSPGMLYVIDPNTAFMNGQCGACDNPNTIGWTKDGGKTWTNGKVQFTGYGPNYLAFSDTNHGWWITTEYNKPSILYSTSDGGTHWTKMHIFK